MHPRSEELLAYLDAQRKILRDAFDAVPRERREQRPADDCWSAVNIIEHLAIVEQRLAGRITHAIAEAQKTGLGPESSNDPILPTLDTRRVVNRTTRVKAPEAIHPTGVGADAAWAALERATAAVHEALRAGDGLAIGTLSLPHPIFGPLSLYHWFGFIGAHEARHAAQIREIADGVPAADAGGSGLEAHN